MSTAKHPCFDKEAKHEYGRVHLPVAPKCNVQCNYCNRKFDCVNESRPGVCSQVLSPQQSLEYLRVILNRGVKISVAGIAGPGDPFSNTQEIFETIRLARAEFPDLIFCLSTNGVDVAPHIDTLKELGVSHVTVTVNAVDPAIVGEMFAWVRYNKRVYRGLEAGKLVVERQEEAVRLLKENGFVVKINTIVIPGLNEDQVPLVAQKMAALGADTMNCIPLHPTKDTAFEDYEEPTPAMMQELRDKISPYIQPMAHCARCRADAAGLLGQDMPEAHALLKEAAQKPLFATEKRPLVAVASYEGFLVNQHLGEAASFMVFGQHQGNYVLVETRKAPEAGSGDQRWVDLARLLNDCSAVLVNGAGANPVQLLKSMGLKVIEMQGLITEGLDAVYKGAPLRGMATKPTHCGDSCGGNGGGCGA